MKAKALVSKISGGALFLLMLACSPATEEAQVNHEEVSPERAEPYTQEGVASYYHRSLAGEPMANGEPYKPNQMTAAHRKLPLGTKVEVVNQRNDSTVVVEITDRGPYAGQRILDVSTAAARKLDFVEEGKTRVELEVVEPADGHTVSDSLPKKQTAGNK